MSLGAVLAGVMCALTIVTHAAEDAGAEEVSQVIRPVGASWDSLRWSKDVGVEVMPRPNVPTNIVWEAYYGAGAGNHIAKYMIRTNTQNRGSGWLFVNRWMFSGPYTRREAYVIGMRLFGWGDLDVIPWTSVTNWQMDVEPPHEHGTEDEAVYFARFSIKIASDLDIRGAELYVGFDKEVWIWNESFWRPGPKYHVRGPIAVRRSDEQEAGWWPLMYACGVALNEGDNHFLVRLSGAERRCRLSVLIPLYSKGNLLSPSSLRSYHGK